MVPLFKKPVFWLGAALPLVIFAAMWRVSSRRPRLLGSLDSPAQALAVSRDGSRVAVLTENGAARFWTSQNNDFLGLPFDGLGAFRSTSSGLGGADSPVLQFWPDEKSVFASSSLRADTSGEMARVWSLPDRKPVWSALPNGKDDFSRFWLSSDGTRLVQRTWTWVKIFDLTKSSTPRASELSRSARNFTLVRRFDFHNTKTLMPQGLALSPDNKTLVVLSSSGPLEFWDVKTAKRTLQTPPPPRPQGNISALSLSPDGRFIALCDNMGVFVWNTATSVWTQTSSYSSFERSIAWASDSRSLWTGGDKVEQWRAPDLKPLRTLPVSGPVALSSDGKTLVTRNVPRTGEGNGVWAWNIG